ncbi:MAG: hypothetical protein AAGE76_12690 [Pseudomonadota bacterium]
MKLTLLTTVASFGLSGMAFAGGCLWGDHGGASASAAQTPIPTAEADTTADTPLPLLPLVDEPVETEEG